MNEAETRTNYILPALQAAGWGSLEGTRLREEYPITEGRLIGGGQHTAPLKADYMLVYRNTNLAVVEAKAWDEHVTEGLAQAKNYASMLAVRFAYSSNGQGIYGADMALGQEGDVSAFPSPEELWDRTFAEKNAWRDRFAAVPFEDKGGSHPGRYYQDIAVQRVLEAIAGQRDRILLTLATGTGKTFIAFQIAWKLFHSRWSLGGEPTRRPRILFLADRNILANQAYNAFSAFPEDALVRIAPDEIRKKGKVPKNGSIFFTIFQTFMCGPEDSEYFGDYPPDFFDIIIIDECHRGGAKDESSWRGILDYFAPAVKLGLTATPKRKDNVDTYAYFGEPVYTYSLKQGVNDGFLTPFKLKQIATTLDEYVYTPDDILVEGEVEEGKYYTEPDFNKIIEIKEREAYRVKVFMEQMNQDEKSLVFCATQAHALAVRDLINQMSSSTNPLYCVRVTAKDGILGDQHLRDFQDNEKTIPTILTTSQKLSTGVDARNVRNIVLMRPVNSMIEFKQIIGRGTRLFEGKDYFTIYDFVQAHHHFSDPEWDGEPEAEEKEGPTTQSAAAAPDPQEKPPAEGKERKQKTVIKLADGKERSIQHMMSTSFWSADGIPMSSAQFMESMFGVLPEFFKNETELRAIWSKPDTRKALLAGLSDKGYGRDTMFEMQRVIEAENSDLFDVLAYVAYALHPETRETRASQAKVLIHDNYSDRQRAFLEFVLAQYVKQGMDELDEGKLSPLLKLKYQDAIFDAVADLGSAEEIREVFTGFQQFLYKKVI